MLLEVSSQIGSGTFQCRTGFGGKYQQLMCPPWFRSLHGRGFLKNYVGIGSPNTKGTDPSPARSLVLFPFRPRGIDIKRTVCEINFGIRLLEMQTGWE